jgi:copper homeostasis protein
MRCCPRKVAADVPLLEIAANSFDSALAAQQGGAQRIELCGALELSGLTPSPGLIELVRERVRIPVYVLIRPRAGDFVYSEAEFATMQRDVERCRALGCDGVVIGGLTEDGDVDVSRCRALVAAAGTLGVTFHRAFDLARDLHAALDAALALGCERVLTSGGKSDALAGAETIRDLRLYAGERIFVMPGAGIDASNVASIRSTTGATEFHASAKRQLPSRQRVPDRAHAGMNGGEWRSDVEQVRAIVAALNAAA